MRIRLQAALVLTLFSLACTSEDASARAHCVTMAIGTEGGTITTLGASAVFPPRAFATTTEVGICLVEVGRVPSQFSDMFEFTPVHAALRTSVQITLPVDLPAPDDLIAEVRDAPSGPLLAVFATHRDADATTVTFDATQLGDIRLLEDASPGIDGGMSPTDTNRPDAPRPIGPVAVGPDLVPANYACLGTRHTPPVGDVMPLSIHVVDWADQLPRADYTVQTAPTWPEGTTDCTTLPDCAQGITDASGDVTLTVRAGPVFVLVPTSGSTTDASHTVSPSWVLGRSVIAGATTLDVAALSQRTASALNTVMGIPTPFALGIIRDCNGDPIQRARVRAFDNLNVEVMTTAFGTPAILYGNGLGFPAGGTDRSTRDGVFLAMAQSSQPGRIEVWGRLSLDTPDVLLSCEAVTYAMGSAATLLDLLPLAADALSECGSVP